MVQSICMAILMAAVIAETTALAQWSRQVDLQAIPIVLTAEAPLPR